MQIKDLYKEVDEYIAIITEYPNIFYDNMEIIYRLALMHYNIYNEIEDPNLNDLTYVGILKNIDLVKDYYKKNNINVDVDKIISNGTIEMINHSAEDECEHATIGGVNNYINGHKSVRVEGNGTTMDGAILVHEISHYRNQPDTRRSQINNLFTEAIAYLEELLYVDYLEENGYKNDAKIIRRFNLNLSNRFIEDYYKLLKMLILYKNTRDISKESFEKYYSDENTKYEDYIKELTNYTSLHAACWDIFGFAISIYLYMEYKKNKLSQKTIDKLHIAINRSLNESIMLTNLEGIFYNDLEDIFNSLIEYKEMIETKELVKKH